MKALSGSVASLRDRMGLPAGSSWKGINSATIIPAQQRAGIALTGRIDPQTAIAFGYYSPSEILPPDQLIYAGGGQKPGTFNRDLATASAQIPWWAWTGIGIGLVGIGVYIYAKNRKKAGATALPAGGGK